MFSSIRRVLTYDQRLTELSPLHILNAFLNILAVPNKAVKLLLLLLLHYYYYYYYYYIITIIITVIIIAVFAGRCKSGVIPDVSPLTYIFKSIIQFDHYR